MMTICGKYFYGNEVSEYGQKNGYVDYRTLAKAFDAVMCNDLMQQTDGAGLGYWEQESGFIDNSEQIEELENQIEELEDMITEDSTEEQDEETTAKIDELREQIEELEEEQDRQPDIFQWFIVDNQGAQILDEAGEIVYYNSTLDLYLWGVTHWGTSWDYVLTNIKIDPNKEF